jgi:hypothetical protein
MPTIATNRAQQLLKFPVIPKKVGGLHKAQSSKQDKSLSHWVIELQTSNQGSHF